MSKMVNELIEEGYLKSDVVIDAFSNISRIEFVPKELELEAEANIALPIGYGQTISQPLVVAFMLELLEPKQGQKIMDIGSGSGWTTALLSYIVGEGDKVIAIERIPELEKFGKENVDKFGFITKGIAEFHNVDGSLGYPEEAPFDRILVSASAMEIPEALKDQVKVGGKIVIPTKNSIIYLEKQEDNTFFREEFPGFTFVPLVINK